ncbi:helix-turn-helix domain-containing protein [Halalkalicoccus sp. NIPERK01]|uniref:winged helix-turn-helix domain-containing protein n=1 Tax=Halalkalicoccus sp. NIPERK01 TaxID=3053469 RepID=UPI00256EF485|nr:helix-turn-helix domain-containing protein [Halalkalicoccus sp. NIPERK01]MDL5362309.1 helix-turn-helix domain-containing protein [Halalkalicoccus sp. NIPERK01]
MLRTGDGRDVPDPDAVFRALDDRTCREIITELGEPRTVTEIAERCDIPLSTTYRKVERLDEASLVTQQTEIRRGGHHRALYRADFVTVRAFVSPERSLDVAIDRPVSEPQEGLVSLWSELRRET